MIALVRYAGRDAFRSQRWVAPLLCFAAIDAVISAPAGSALPSFALGAAALVFVATWLTVVIVNSEDPVQLTITEVCAGSPTRVRLAKLVLSLVTAVVVGVLGMIGPAVVAGPPTAGQVVAGVGAQAICAVAGVAFGAVCSRPIVDRRAWAVLLGVGLGLATVLIPHGPPTRQLLVLFNETGHLALGVPVVLIGVETLVLAGAVTAWSLGAARRRS